MSKAVPATTPFPNTLLAEAMPVLKDTEWRLLCVIVRQTLGHYDHRTKARKQRDWLTREQLKARTGRDSEALAKAIDVLVRKRYIVAEDEAGTLLATPQERRSNQNRIYYRLTNRVYPVLSNPNRPSANDTPNSSDTPRPKSEHKRSPTAPLPSSVYRPALRKSELETAAKPNTTKETLTKENGTKELHQISLDRNSLNDLVTEVFSGKASKIGDAAIPNASLHIQPEYSDLAQNFITLFKQLHRDAKKGKADTRLAADSAARLEVVLASQPALDWATVLRDFFAIDTGYIVRRNHSLEAFLSSCNIFLARHAPLTRNMTDMSRSGRNRVKVN